MDSKVVEKLDTIKRAVDLLITIELAKAEATRKQVREVVGSLDNNTFAKIKTVFGKKNKTHKG